METRNIGCVQKGFCDPKFYQLEGLNLGQ